jgi:hypothetical protein
MLTADCVEVAFGSACPEMVQSYLEECDALLARLNQ